MGTSLPMKSLGNSIDSSRGNSPQMGHGDCAVVGAAWALLQKNACPLGLPMVQSDVVMVGPTSERIAQWEMVAVG